MRNFLNNVFDRTLNFCKKKRADSILYFISTIESIFFPIPTDIFLIPYILAKKEQYLKIIFLTTIFSVIGGVLAYYIGVYFWQTISPWVFNNYPLTFDKINEFQNSFNTLGFLLVLIGGFSPFPYKITCLGSGIIGVNFYIFFISSLLSRGLRFFLVGYFFYKFNSLAKNIVNKYINIISIVLVAASFIYLIYFRN